MSYRLKKGVESFEVVDGDPRFVGRKYVRGKVYGEVPPEERHKFEDVQAEAIKKLGAKGKSPKAGAATGPESSPHGSLEIARAVKDDGSL